ncbi:hypothetical protein N658DRAFT_496850 [Parathielavia hyrcaniae]|uniref:Transmembrane protein n=1 Tax=Parathielavia hyrcaniae TaxID=113614 RepID=A0AAN6T0Z1_9PEZI|nr:hypothetical protein N658DRAFT_496850 [Parathielavia hyrcaniae]
MQSLNSTFVRTEIPVWGNSIKSLIFRAAELLLGFAIWRLFSLLAAAQNRFTSFLLFAESPVQKAHFVFTRGLSTDALLVASFTIIYAAGQLYGTLLWTIDAPGHVIRSQHVPASSLSGSILDTPEYIVSYTVTPSSLNLTDAELREALSVNLFRSDANATLTGLFDQGAPESVPAPTGRPHAGPRIWLDDEGWSVSTDLDFHTKVNLGADDSLKNQLNCAYGDLGASRIYNCTFDNQWSPRLLDAIVGVPVVHYNEPADSAANYGRVPPARDDVWTAEGRGSGAAVRIHMFTVTKGHRRHTFVSIIAKSSIVATAGELPEIEMEGLIRRLSVPEPGQEAAVEQGITMILGTMTAAQNQNQSAAVGWVLGDERPNQLLEGFWEFLSVDRFPGEIFARVFRFTSVNITLLRSETISTPPVPFAPCDSSQQNIAFGGKVTQTTCVTWADPTHPDASYFGQVDTSAVLHLGGLDKPPFASSAEALDPVLFPWVNNVTEKLTKLLLSRGYLLGLDPALVTVESFKATPGISYLQLFMVLLAAMLAVVSWLSLWLCASGHWSSSFLVNVLVTAGVAQGGDKQEPGVVCHVPDIYLEKQEGGVELTTDTGLFTHQIDSLPGQTK